MWYQRLRSYRFCDYFDVFGERMEFEKAICMTGYGRFHYELLASCAISLLSVGFQNGLSAYVFPAAQCELNLTSSQLGLVNACFLVGGTLSSFLWGILADSKGRRKILILCHLTNATITLCCALHRSVIALILCRFLNGFFVGGPGSIVFSYLGEFQPSRRRSATICYSGLFFTSSWLLLPLAAYVILPLGGLSCDLGPFFAVRPWRAFLVLLALPELVAGLWFMRMPESPKFYIAKGNTRRALIVLRRMYAANSGRHPDDFAVKHLLNEMKVPNKIARNLQCKGKAAQVLDKICLQCQNLFRPPLLFITALTCMIMCTNMFGVFGLGLWLPELFTRFERFHTLHPNLTISVKELSQFASNATESNATCGAAFFEPSVIRTTAAMGVSSLVANALSGFFASRVSLRVIPCVTMLLGGISAATIYFLTSSLQNLIAASIFQSAMVTANMTIGGVIVDLFPTSVGAMAICVAMCAGRVGAICSNIVFGYLMDTHCEVPIFLVAVAVLFGAVLCFFIPVKHEERKCWQGKPTIDISVTKF